MPKNKIVTKEAADKGRRTRNVSFPPNMEQWLEHKAATEADNNFSQAVRNVVRKAMNEEKEGQNDSTYTLH